jgi:hypothetical protein
MTAWGGVGSRQCAVIFLSNESFCFFFQKEGLS